MKARSKARRAGRKQKPKTVSLAHIAFVEVDNPMHSRDHAESASNPRKIQAAFNMRESYIGYLHHWKFITDAEKRAADRIRQAVECLGGANMAMDYGREPVDGGGNRGEPITERQWQSLKVMDQVRTRLGQQGHEIVVAMCAHNEWPQELPRPNERIKHYRSLRLRECLEEMAIEWGWASRRYVSFSRG